MGDVETDHDESVDTGDDSVEETAEDATEDESETSENTDDEDAEESEDSAADEGDDDDGKGDSDDETDTADDDEPEDDDSEPELRKPQKGASNAEWAAYRKQQKAKAAEAQKSGKDSDDTDDDAEDSDDDELSPEDAAAIDKRIAKAIEPFKKQAAEQEVDTEIASFLNENPDFKPYADKVRRWALHPNRQNVPVKSIFYEVAGPKLMTIGAKRAKAADAKAQKTKSAASRPAGDKGNKSYKDMPLTDFEQELNAAKLGK